MISYIYEHITGKPCKTKMLGQFCKIEKGDIWGYWQTLGSKELSDTLGFMPRNKVTFEFRPKSKPRDC